MGVDRSTIDNGMIGMGGQDVDMHGGDYSGVHGEEPPEDEFAALMAAIRQDGT